MLGTKYEACLLVFSLLSAALACLWIKSKLTYDKTPVLTTPSRGNPKDPIVLVGWAKMPALPGATAVQYSPFVSKTETWLRFAKLPYTYEGTVKPADGPKGQFPYIKHGKNVVGDTAFIPKYLEATYGKPPQNSALQPLQPQAQALCTLCNTIAMERLVWYTTHSRFVPDLGWRNTKVMLSFLPKLLQPILLPFIRASTVHRLGLQGFARHSEHDLNILLHDDLTALSTILGDKPYLLGDAPCEADAAMFGSLDIILYGQATAPQLTQTVQQYPTLCQHTMRIRDTYYPDRVQSSSRHPQTDKRA